MWACPGPQYCVAPRARSETVKGVLTHQKGVIRIVSLFALQLPPPRPPAQHLVSFVFSLPERVRSCQGHTALKEQGHSHSNVPPLELMGSLLRGRCNTFQQRLFIFPELKLGPREPQAGQLSGMNQTLRELSADPPTLHPTNLLRLGFFFY